ncbi:sulfotransferase [Thalassoporum mexicanum PCC 7367]|uniref:sulfotransferase family protein n=1 Tax=Thalassoporum mexicanum TaxID=3457544 RepID=UPI00029F808C|nr:sulfotransferase [Pseudanabaena sp. PCC 7367]AFY68566.1 sulfotransferase [Pseudanabaena sp. PCC 7367]
MTSKTEIQPFKAPELFIVSSGRSGTTLLRSILNATEQIYIPYESDFIARVYPYYHDQTTFSEVDYRQIIKLFYETTEVAGWEMAADFILESLIQAAPQSFADVNSVIYSAYLQANGLTQFAYGIKSPVLIASLDRVFATYPAAKLVHIVRDGRDVCLSYQQVHLKSRVKFGPKGLVANALYWIDGLRRVAEFKRQDQEIEAIELRYEDMLREPDLTFKQLCDFLEIDYRSQMHQDFYKLERNQKLVDQNYMNAFHGKVKSALDPSNTSKYVHKMTRLQKFTYELVAAPYLHKYGYNFDFPWLKFFIFDLIRLPLYWLARIFNNLRYQKRDQATWHWAIEKYGDILEQPNPDPVESVDQAGKTMI